MTIRKKVRNTALVSALAASAVAAVIILPSMGHAAAAYYVSPTGSDSAAGTIAAPFQSIAKAQTAAAAGDTVYLRGGTYAFTTATTACSSQTAVVDAVKLSKSGTAGSPISYVNYPSEKPIFDFSGMTGVSCRIKGFDVTGSYLYLRGIGVTGVLQNNSLNHESWGLWISGSNNTFEKINTHNNMGPGLFIAKGGNNLVLNSDSYNNYDPYSSNGAGENGDGFGAHIAAGNAGNVFRGCRAWWNSDDGFDLINAYSSVTIENSWSWRNGFLPQTTTPIGNGAGFKAGGYGGVYVANAAKHTVRNSVAFLNRGPGFYSNHHPVANDYLNNTSYSNGIGFNMLGINASGAAVGLGTLKNNIAYGGTLTANLSGTTATTNSWNLSVTMNDAQFQSVATTGWNVSRQSNGSLPVLTALHLAATSTLINKGTDAGLPFNGSAPDLGAFETS